METKPVLFPTTTDSCHDTLEISSSETETVISSLSGVTRKSNSDKQKAEEKDLFSSRLAAEFRTARSLEVASVQSVIQKVLDGEDSSSLLWISGVSGVGKTSLVGDAIQSFPTLPSIDDSSSRNCASTKPRLPFYFVMGKFDAARQRCEPYSALLEAFMDLWEMVVQTNQVTPDAVMVPFSRQEKKKHEEEKRQEQEMEMLNRIIFKLSSITMEESNKSSPRERSSNAEAKQKGRSSANTNGSGSFLKFKLLCATFLRKVSSQQPVVIFLDDVQWADDASLLVLESILSDRSCKQVVWVAAYRKDETDSNELLTDLLRNSNNFSRKENRLVRTDLINKSQEKVMRMQYCPPTHTMEIGELELHQIHEIIQVVTNRRDCEDTLSLSHVVFNKTLGNAYFVVQFLELLLRQKLLALQKGKQPKDPVLRDSEPFYEWDTDNVQRQTNVCDRVVDVVESKVQRLPNVVRDVLETAACLGYTIKVATLKLIIRQGSLDVGNHDNQAGFNRTIDHILSIAAREGFIEKVGTRRTNDKRNVDYKFTHDRVQSVLYNLIPEGKDREMKHLEIGRILWTSRTKTTDERLLAMAADHWNRGSTHITSEHERLDLTEFNLRVGALSMNKSAFKSASVYLEAGLKLFNTELLWDRHFQLALDLSSTLAEAYLYAGLPGMGKKVVDEIFARTTSVDDRLRAYFVLVKITAGKGDWEHAQGVVLKVLEQLGEKFPKKPNQMHVIIEFVKTKRSLKGRDPRSLFMNMPPMTDRRKNAVMTLLSIILNHTFMNNKYRDVFTVMGLRLMQITTTSGLNEWTPCGLAVYAVALVATGHIKEACDIGQLAMDVSEKLGRRHNEARHLLHLYHCVFHWQKPFKEVENGFLNCYELALQSGDIDTGLCASVGYMGMSFQGKESMEEIAELGRRDVERMHELGHHTYLSFTIPMWQLALAHLGSSDDPSKLHGEAMNYEEMRGAMVEQNHTLALCLMDFYSLMLALRFHSIEELRKVLRKLERSKKAAKLTFPEYLIDYNMGLAYYMLYREERVWSYKVRASRLTKIMQKRVDNGTVVCRPLWQFLNAVKLSFHSKLPYGSLKEAIDKGLAALSEWKFYEEFAFEHAAMMALEQGNIVDSSKYMQQCLLKNMKSGAVARVNFIQQRYGFLVQGQSAPMHIDIAAEDSKTALLGE